MNASTRKSLWWVLGLALLAAVFGSPPAPAEENGPDIIDVAAANNPQPQTLPTIRVVKEKLWGEYYPTVSVSFPNVPGFTCDSWCYESALDLVNAKPLDGGAIEMRHRDKDHPGVLVITTVTPRPGSVLVEARVETDPAVAVAALPDVPPGINLCWQLRHAEGFASKPDPYPAFVSRCFLFTQKGMTRLSDTDRKKIPVQPPDHEYNNPPWVQMYSPVGKPVPETQANGWAAYSDDQYVVPVIGAVSRDGKYLAAIANDSADTMCQAWHDCMHDNPKWLPENAPVAERRWRLGIYAMENDSVALLDAAMRDFPNIQIPAALQKDGDPVAAAKTLAALDTWVLVPPKQAEALPGQSFDLAAAAGILAAGVPPELVQQAADRLTDASGAKLALLDSPPDKPAVTLVLADAEDKFPEPLKIDAALFDHIGDQGYALAIDGKGVTLAALTPVGLRHGVTTLCQIAGGRKELPGLIIHDWPSMKYRGVQQDISRGQVPKPETLTRLAGVLAEGKMNELELYIEHEYKFKAFPDIGPPEALAPEESHDLAVRAAKLGVEVHPLLQVLGHSYHILNKPQYQHLRIGPCEKAPWIMTFDIRNPEAVKMVTTMIDELCDTFPGELFNVDITEVDINGLQATGMNLDQITDLVFNYVVQLNNTVQKHGRRLMIAQGPLDSQGHLSGMGAKLDQLPRNVIIGSYYCAGGPYQPAYEKDFPRLQEKKIDFFAQAWINSHVWITPWVSHAAEFSDLEVSRGLKYGACGSITCDWGDAGHFHFGGEEWLPFLYHGACAWTGARVDRDYFRNAYARCVYGLSSDAVTRAIEKASDINAMTIQVRDKDGKEVGVSTSFIWEFVHDPFTHPDITRIVDPAAVGQSIVDAAAPALAALNDETPKAARNRDNLEQYIFGVRCYLALGHKFLALGHYKDQAVPRAQAAEELESVAREYESLQGDFQKLWLAEDRDNDGYQELVKRFLYTITPCREKAAALREGKEQVGTTADLGTGGRDVKEFAEKNIHWLGHDTFKLVGEKVVYIDPYKVDRADKADIICITHSHYDHLVPEEIKKLEGPNTVVVAPQDCAAKIPGKVEVIKPGRKLVIEGVEIEAVPAYNTNKEFHPKVNGWVGYIITLDKIRIYHAGDTDRIPEMKNIRADIALLPVSGTYVMTADEAAQAALDIKPEVTIPMHYGAIVGGPSDAHRFQDLLRGKIEVIIKNKE